MEIIAQFVKSDSSREQDQVFRYVIVDGVYRVQIAQLEAADFNEAVHGKAVVEARRNGWDWINDYAPSEDVKTYWSCNIDYEGEFEPGFTIEDMQSDGVIADTYAELRKLVK